MNVAIISDIHGNLEALHKVSEQIQSMNVDAVWCLGDLVGYGPDPGPCVDLTKQLCRTSGESDLPVLLGNHDEAATDGDIMFFNPRAKSAILWTRDQLDEEQKRFLASRPLRLSRADSLLVHASPFNPEDWHYIVGLKDAVLAFPHFEEQVCFVGHSHYPLIIHSTGSEASTIIEQEVTLRDDSRYVINVGSVGQPRDRNPDACFVTFDTEKRYVEFHRVPYDVEACQEKILRAGLPGFLAERLGKGL